VQFPSATPTQHPARNPLRLALLAALLAITSAAHAEENRYDLLGRALMPFVNVFAKTTRNPNRALSLTARLELLTGLPPELAGTRADLALQFPDKLRLHGPLLGDEITICRNGQHVWAHPASKIAPLLDTSPAKPDPKARIEPFQLPVPEKQLVFLPALFQVKDAGAEPLDGAPCRVLDLALMPELAKSKNAQGWAARLWLHDDATPARLSVVKPKWQIAVRFERVEFSKALPPETWKPTAAQADDVLNLDAAQYERLLESLVK
jgi:hypothetical protein